MEAELEFASISLRTIYREFMPSVYRMAFSYMQNHPDSEDAVQEAFLRLAQSGKKFQDKRQVQAWLIITVANICKDQLRRSRRRELPLEAAANAAAPSERSGGLREAVLQLPQKYRTVIYLHYFEGYSVQELAKLLHRPEGTVKTWLRRGRDSLRERLGEEGGIEL